MTSRDCSCGRCDGRSPRLEPFQRRVTFQIYRDMSGVKLPFQMLTTWIDGQTTIQLTDVRLNVPIEPSKFAKPAPPLNAQSPESIGSTTCHLFSPFNSLVAE